MAILAKLVPRGRVVVSSLAIHNIDEFTTSTSVTCATTPAACGLSPRQGAS